MTADLVIYGAGPRDPVPLDPASVAFRVQPADSCRGCAFDGQWSAVCKRAAELAVRAGLEDCDSGVIYVAPDARQMDILSGAAPGATGTAPVIET